MSGKTQEVVLIGWGAIASTLFRRMQDHPQVRITHVVASAASVQRVQNELAGQVQVVTAVPPAASLVLECAGHSALLMHVLPALRRGVECAVLSVGALSEPGLPEQLEQAAREGGTQLHLLAGAIGGIDAVAAARQAGIDELVYTGRKPPAGWRGSPAEQVVDLDSLEQPAVIFQASAREAARLYPKNANVAATLSLAGIGLDRTQVRLIADPTVTENIHEYSVRGAFGDMQVTMRGKPLAENPKTSALTVLSAWRFLNNRVAPLTL